MDYRNRLFRTPMQRSIIDLIKQNELFYKALGEFGAGLMYKTDSNMLTSIM